MDISFNRIEQAHERIRPYIHQTPVLSNASINALAGAEVLFKCENFQKIGAFKIRGGMNAALSLNKEQLEKGIATHSSGNHAQAVAFAARQLGTRAYIVMPRTSPRVKVNAVEGYGAQVTFCEPNQAAREAAIAKIVEETGAEFIHPYDDERVITGQATCAKEFIEEIPGLDAIVVPVGGGGMLSGTSLTVSHLLPDTEIYAAEPEGAADAILSMKSGHVEKAPFIQTIADGLMTTMSERTLGIARPRIKEVLLVSDEEIKNALKLVYERMKIVIEPSSATVLAAVLRNKERFKGKKVGLIITGGNVDLVKLSEWFG